MSISSADPKLTIRSLEKGYGEGSRQELTALTDINLSVKEGEFISLVGPSGCGKSTLLSTIAGRVSPTSGQIFVDGEEVKRPGPDRGMLFQDYALFPWKTVYQNIEFGLRYGPTRYRKNREERKDIVARLISTIGLEGTENKYPHQLSGGMRQRVALGRLWAPSPEVL